jgi:hypothetical protein
MQAIQTTAANRIAATTQYAQNYEVALSQLQILE